MGRRQHQLRHLGNHGDERTLESGKGQQASPAVPRARSISRSRSGHVCMVLAFRGLEPSWGGPSPAPAWPWPAAETWATGVRGSKPLLLGFLLELLLQLPDLGLQGRDGGLELGLDGALQLLQLGLQLLVLPLQLLARVVALLRSAALGRQLRVECVHLEWRGELGSVARPEGRCGPSQRQRGHLQRGLAEAVVEQLHVALLLFQLLLQLCDPRLQTPLLIQQRRPGRAGERRGGAGSPWGCTAPGHAGQGAAPHPAMSSSAGFVWLPSPSPPASPPRHTSHLLPLSPHPSPALARSLCPCPLAAQTAAGVPFWKGETTARALAWTAWVCQRTAVRCPCAPGSAARRIKHRNWEKGLPEKRAQRRAGLKRSA